MVVLVDGDVPEKAWAAGLFFDNIVVLSQDVVSIVVVDVEVEGSVIGPGAENDEKLRTACLS